MQCAAHPVTAPASRPGISRAQALPESGGWPANSKAVTGGSAADCRHDALHKFSTDLVRRFDVITLEDLNVRGLAKNHHLARALRDTVLGQAGRLTEEKAERARQTVVWIDRFYPSSKARSSCGHLFSSLALSWREWTGLKRGRLECRAE